MIGIVTFHNAINEGSMLQAACLAEMVRRVTGERPVVIDYRSPHRDKVYANHPCRDTLLGFMEGHFRLSPTFTDPAEAAAWANANCDTVLFGSDEIWKWNQPAYCDPFPTLFWGHGVTARKVAYAVSIGGSDPAKPPQEARRLVGEFAGVSVRDAASEALVRPLGPYKRLPDPTLGVSPLDVFPDALAEAERLVRGRRRPLLFLTDSYMKHLAVGWEGEVLTTDPDSLGPLTPPVWAAVHALADRVASQRFHSTLMAMRFGREAVCDSQRPKVKDLLAQVGGSPGRTPIAWDAGRIEALLRSAERDHDAFLREVLLGRDR